MKFTRLLEDDPCPCGICEAINRSYYEDEESQCQGATTNLSGGSACIDKDKALIKLLYHLLIKK